MKQKVYRSYFQGIFGLFCLFLVLVTGVVRADRQREAFASPPLHYAPRPLWFWNNTAVSEEEIVRQMQQARDCGYGGFGILPFGPHFKPDYLSDSYFKLYETALETAKELGMTMCLYDEYGFPSGSAGAINGDGTPRFKNAYPEHTIKRLDKHEQDVAGPAEYTAAIPDGRLMSAVAMEINTKKRIDLREFVKDRQLTWSCPEGAWKVMICVCVKDGDPNVDYLSAEAVRHFIEMTHQQYYNRFKDYFGTTLTGTFYDEPTLYRAAGRIWTGTFNEMFESEYGFDPAIYYPALWYDIGPDTQAARNYLFGFRSELYASAFAGTIQQWCSSHGPITATGHQDQEEVVNPVSVAGDLMKCFKYQDVPGIDKIGGDRPAERFYKLISSAAYNWDKALVMSETYGAMGDLSWDTIYRVAMEQYTKGINELIPHAVWYDDSNVTFKPELSWRHDRYAAKLPHFNRYLSRLNLMLQNHGRHVADIAVLYPIAGLQGAHYLDGSGGAYAGGVTVSEADYVTLAELLSTNLGRDFTFIHPDVLNERCHIEGDTLKLNNRVHYEQYKVVMMPAQKTMDWNNLKTIKAFYDAGGQVIATGVLPYQSAEFGHDEDVVRTIREMFPDADSEGRKSIIAASSSWPGYEAENACDGDTATRWNAADGTSSNQWLEIHFNSKQTFNKVEIREIFDRITAYSIQYLSGDKWLDCAEGTTLGHKMHTFEPITASHVRLYIHSIKSDSASIAEFKVLDNHKQLGDNLHTPVINRNDRGGRAVFLNKPTADNLRQTLDRMVSVYDVTFEPGHALGYIHKVHEGKEIYFFANLSEVTIANKVTFRGKLTPELWNPHTGQISIPDYSSDKRGSAAITRVAISLGPTESVFIIAETD
jgi:hypothetical protein